MSNSRLCKIGIGACVALGISAGASSVEAGGRFDPARPVFDWTANSGTGSTAEKTTGTRSSRYSSLIAKYAKANGIPLALAHAVVRIESNYNERARGGAGEIGLMQVKPSTARMIGFSGKAKALYDPAINLQWGMKYLGDAHQLAGGDICGTILRYNAGHYAKRMNPVSARYCRRVKAVLKEASFEPERKPAFFFLASSDNH